jgi:hypothetical protein
MMKCTLYYNKKTNTPHLRQIFTGFFELHKKGFIDVTLEHKDWLPSSYTHNLLMAVIDNKERVIYDVNDGLYWIYGSKEENLRYFDETLASQSDFFFKRSYTDQLLQHQQFNSSKIYPLGFNYEVTSEANQMDKTHLSAKSWLKHRIKSTRWTSKLLKVKSEKILQYHNFEYIPLSKNKQPKILFLTRLWAPDTVRSEKIKDAKLLEEAVANLHEINKVRVESIKLCKKHFGDQFVGGLFADAYSTQNHLELIAPSEATNKENYLNIIKQSDICIATTGLHNSIGWKFAEYVAAARGIISEKLHYQLPGNFTSPTHYLEFETVDQLIANIYQLVENPDILRAMMQNNYNYYNLFVRPDNLVLNTLLTVKSNRK